MIIVRQNKSKIKIIVTIFLDVTKGAVYNFMLAQLPVGKRKWIYIRQDSYAWRALSIEDREKSDRSLYLQFVTEAEIKAAKFELWEKLKPTV